MIRGKMRFWIKKKRRMTQQEIHEYGIAYVQTFLKDNGFEIEKVMTDREVLPQLIAERNGYRVYVGVRTECYPAKGTLSRVNRRQLIDLAEKNGSTACFAGLGICNGDGRSDKERGRPAHGAKLFIGFDGIESLQTAGTTLERQPEGSEDFSRQFGCGLDLAADIRK